jgi:hypothetical protein
LKPRQVNFDRVLIAWADEFIQDLRHAALDARGRDGRPARQLRRLAQRPADADGGRRFSGVSVDLARAGGRAHHAHMGGAWIFIRFGNRQRTCAEEAGL